MSEVFSALVRRVEKLEQRGEPETYPSYIRGRDRVLGSAVDRVAKTTVSINVGALLAGDNVFAVGSHVWGTYATGGVTLTDKPSAPSEVGVLFDPIVCAGVGVFFPRWNSGTEKVLVYDIGGNEVAAATDLSTAGTQKYQVLGSRRADRVFWRALDSGRITAVRFQIGGTFTANASNYWTLSVTRRRTALDQTIGDVLGDAVSLDTLSLSAQGVVTLYEAPAGTEVSEGDTLVLYANRTGVPAPLDDLVMFVDVQRLVR